MLSAMNRVLVVAVHPDDETLGCGGTLLKHKKIGDKTFWLIITSMKPENGFSGESIHRRDKEIARVASLYRFTGLYRLDLPATELDIVSRNTLVKGIASVFNKVKPTIVYLPFKNDIHSDHNVAFNAAYSCTKTFRSPSIKKVLMMETISETELVSPSQSTVFKPNYFSDISQYLNGKIEIMKVFKGQMKKHPFPRSVKNIESLAAFRGAMSGCKYAEAFMLLKEIS